MAEAATSSVETFSSLPYDVHVIIVKLLNLKEALVYGENYTFNWESCSYFLSFPIEGN